MTIFLDIPAPAFDADVAFWRAVTGYGLSPARGDHGQFATLLPPSGDAYLRVQRTAAGAGGCHLDLHVDRAAETLAAAAGRAVAAGARTGHQEDGLIVASSPGGFPFCLVDWDHEETVPPPRAEPGGASRIDTLCLDVPPDDFERECAFWAELTAEQVRPARIAGFSYLTRPPGWPARLLFQRRDQAGPADQVRGHLDFGCTDPDAVRRHAELGARVLARHQHWTVLADPAGREYCLIGRDPG
jgi:hypothetical protein